MKCLKEHPDDVLILSNLSAVHIELKAFDQALKYAQDGLKMDPSHVKCLYRSGLANMHLEQYKTAVSDLDKAKRLVRHIQCQSVMS